MYIEVLFAVIVRGASFIATKIALRLPHGQVKVGRDIARVRLINLKD
jgi:hypothetical protein